MFGYKAPKQFEFSRIWCLREIDIDYKNNNETEEEFSERLIDFQIKNPQSFTIPVKELKKYQNYLFLVDDKTQRMTRTTVARPKIERFSKIITLCEMNVRFLQL